MERIRIERKARRRRESGWMARPAALPLDPRDPDVVRAKRVLEGGRLAARAVGDGRRSTVYLER